MLNIRQLSQLLGISSQTIRQYEQHGIFQAARSESNYRKFDRRAIATLMKCRKLMTMGFSIKQIVEIAKGISYKDGQKMLRRQADEIEKEIKLLVEKRKCIAHMYTTIRNIQNRQGTCEIITEPAIYRLPVMRNDKLLFPKGDPMLDKWNEYAFIRHDVKCFSKEALMDGATDGDVVVEYSAKADDALRIGLDVSKANYMESQTVLIAYAACPANEMKPVHELFGFAADYIREHHLNITHDPLLFLPFWPQQGEYDLHFVLGVYIDAEKTS